MAYGSVFYTDPGSGTEVYFDELSGGEKVQACKLLDATAGDPNPIGVDANPIVVKVHEVTVDALSTFRSLDLDETEEAVKASAGTVYGWFISNGGSATNYVKFYNATTANVTVGSTTPQMTLPIPAGAAANVEFANGIEFTTAITVASTTGAADNDTTGSGTGEVIVNIFYK